MLNYLLPVVLLTTTETEGRIMESVQPRQVGCPLIFISMWLKAKIGGSNLYLQSLYTWPLASSLSSHIHSQCHHFLFSHQILLYWFLSFLQSVISLHMLIPVCLFFFLLLLYSLILLWNKIGSYSLKNHLMTLKSFTYTDCGHECHGVIWL